MCILFAIPCRLPATKARSELGLPYVYSRAVLPLFKQGSKTKVSLVYLTSTDLNSEFYNAWY